MNNKWMYDIYNSEIWNSSEFDTKEEAIEEGKIDLINFNKLRIKKGLEPIKEFYIGRQEVVSPCGVDVDFILENVAENTVQGMEAGEDYLGDVTKEHRDELEQELNNVLFTWMNEHGYNPNFFTIENEETIIL